MMSSVQGIIYHLEAWSPELASDASQQNISHIVPYVGCKRAGHIHRYGWVMSVMGYWVASENTQTPKFQIFPGRMGIFLENSIQFYSLFNRIMPHGSNNVEVLSVLLILLVIVTVNNARNHHRLTKFSPWINLLRNADDGSFLTITGFSRFAFNELEKVLFDADEIPSVGSKRGRPELIDNKGKLGIYLLL